MSNSTFSASGKLKLVYLTLGLILVLGALGGFYYTGANCWKMWQQAHPKTEPAKLPARAAVPHSSGVASKIPPAAPAPKVTVLDIVSKQGTWLMGEIVALILGIYLLQKSGQKAAPIIPDSQELTIVSVPKIVKRPTKRWQFCNILQLGADTRRLWSFNIGKNGFSLNQQQAIPAAQPLPPKAVGRDWTVLLQPKLNIAWLPIEQVFLRVIQLPAGDFAETLAMVDLQLEKISPLPATQIVWTVEVLPKVTDNLQTVIVVMVARDIVEKYLGELEAMGYLAERLELPILDQLLATSIKEDGAYIYPDEATGKFTALVAWWYGGVLRNLGLVHLPATENRALVLKEQLAQMAWSGELEGWLSGSPTWHLVADEATAENWQAMFRSWLGQPVKAIAPLPMPQLATTSANRAARAGLAPGIIPVEYTTRYTQEFHDRLWMKGLGVVLGLYIAGVAVYWAGATWQGFHADTVTSEMSNLSRSYTNTMQLKAQLEVLQNRQALKFASLDCWKVSAEFLPEGVTIQNLDFKDGKEFSLSGIAPGDSGGLITDFNEALRKATLNDQPMFEELTIPSQKLNPGGSTLTWSFSGKLARAEELK
jgi:hypothetical protein